MDTAAPSRLQDHRPPGRWSAVARLLLLGTAVALFGTFEARRADSVLPAVDDHLLGVLQKFLPHARNGPLVLEARPDDDTRVFAPAPDDSPLPVPLCRYERADQTILVEWPPGPVDLAMAIETLGAAKTLALAWTPQWDAPAEGTLALRAFANARAQAPDLPFLHAYWPGDTAAADDAARALLEQPLALAPAKVRGDTGNLPEVNDPGPWPPEATGLRPADAGFGRLLLLSPLQAPPGRVALPMLVRCGDRILPSLALLSFVRAKGLDLDAVDVHLGRAILAGKTAIPVDDRGCLLLPDSFAKRVPVFSPLAEEAHALARDKPVVVAYEGLPALPGTTGDVGLWTAAALGAMEAGDFALPIRILHRAPASIGLGVLALLVVGSALSLWLPRRQRWWVALILFIALAISAREAAAGQGQFIGLSLPLFLWLATSLLAILQGPALSRQAAQAVATEISPPTRAAVAEQKPDAVPPSESARPGTPPSTTVPKNRPKSGKNRRKG